VNSEQLLSRLRSDLRDWLAMLAGADAGRKHYIDGRIQALSDVIELLAGAPEVVFGQCPSCRHMGYVFPLGPRCPACGRLVTVKEWQDE